jgi:two-component system NarL family sensor kinase
VLVKLTKSGSRLQLVVADDGVGFDVEEARTRGGLGLRSMEERAWLVAGSIELASRTGAGTTVTVTIEPGESSESAAPSLAMVRKTG